MALYGSAGFILTNHCFEISGSTTGSYSAGIAHTQRVSGSILTSKPNFFEIGTRAAGFEAVEAGVGAGGFGFIGRFVYDPDFGQVVALAAFKVVEIVGGP